MAKEMLINVSQGEECRIALMEDGRLEELYMERTSSTSHVGNIYKGRVTNVEPSIQAAFVDFGLGRNGFLHISDLMPTYFGRRGEDIHESVGRKMARRDRPPIQRCLRRGDDIIVQIIKEGIGTKGPTLSTYLSIPGKILVMMPGMGKMGVSKKIEDDQERRRLRQILDGLKPPKDVAFIIRTAGVGKSKTEIERDLKYLTRLWETLKKKEKEAGPVELYTEGDLVTRTVRDVFSTDVDRIIVDNKDVAKRVKEVIKISSPRARNKVELYEEPIPLFHKFGIEKEIELMYSRHVPLPSGGSLVIDSTEAIVAIDVNSGKFRDHNDAEMTAFKTDMEAAEEIPRQLKLRDLGGVIICDFIDLRYERHRRDLEKKLHDNFQRDRAKTKVLRMSQFGIIELTRQRMRPSLKRSIYFDCPHCKGAGLVKTPESMSLDVMRKLAIALNDLKVVRAQLSVCPDVAFYLLNKKRAALTELEQQTGKKVLISSDASLGLDEQKFELLDARDGLVILEEIGMTLPMHPHTSQLGVRPAGHTHQGRGGRQGDQRGGSGRRDQRGGRGKDQRSAPARSMEPDPEDLDEDRMAIERDEENLDGEQWEESSGGLSRARGEATPEREEDTPGIPSVLETEAGDEVAEEIADEEAAPEEQITPGRRPPPRQLPHKASPPRGIAPKGGAIKPTPPKPPLQKPVPMNRPDRPAPAQRGPDGRGGDEEGGPRGRRRRRGRRGRGGSKNGGQNIAPTAQPNIAAPVAPGSPFRPRPKSIAEMAGLIAEELANESGSGPEEDSPEVRNSRPPAVGTANQVEPNDDIGPANQGGPANFDNENGDQPRRRRRRRGGRRHRRRNEGGENGEAPAPNGGQAENSSSDEGGDDRDGGPRSRPAPRALPQRIPPKLPTQTIVVESPAVVRTGSADKHLASDEPVAPQPASRPRSYRDLDAIPDDYD